MAAISNIEWTDRTWNPVRGCSIVSPGCVNCYAMKFAHRFSGEGKAYEGLTKQTKAGPQWTGKVRLVEDALLEPLKWRKPQRVFVNSMSDLFHELVPDEFIDRVFAVMALAPHHIFQILTKRPLRMRDYLKSRATSAQFWKDAARIVGYSLEFQGVSLVWYPLPNVWLGVSCEDQRRADERIPLLLQTPAAVRFISAEPLLGPIEIRGPKETCGDCDPCIGGRPDQCAVGGYYTGALHPDGIHWVIVGGESGPKSRPCDIAWIRSIIEQCQAETVPAFVKQLGTEPRGSCRWRHHDKYPPEWLDKDGCLPSVSGQPAVDLCHAVDDSWGPCKPKLKSRKGGDPSEWPADLRVREFPPLFTTNAKRLKGA